MANTAAQTNEIIAKVLNIPIDGPWEIISELPEENLYMVHYKNDVDPNEYPDLRGVVVDIKNKTVVSKSFPHTKRVVTNEIKFDNDNNITLFDDKNTQLKYNLDNVQFKVGFEGPLIHVFKHNGNVYRTTRKKLDASRSRWGNSMRFGEMYETLGGPSDETLFNPEKKYSPYCHVFIMVHPDTLVACRDDIKDGYLVYLGPKKMYSTSPENCPYDFSEVDEDLHVPETSSLQKDKNIFSPENIELAEVNKHLMFGFYDPIEGYQYLDKRLLPGEFVIMEELDENKNVKSMVRIESVSYAWRCSMRNNNPNLHHRFYELLDYSYLKNDPFNRERFEKLFPILTCYEYSSLVEGMKNSPIVVWPQKTDLLHDFPLSNDTKLYNIWQCYLVSSPLNKQQEIAEYLQNLYNKRYELINWLYQLSKNKTDPTKFSKRVADILIKTRKFAKQRIAKNQNVDRKTGKVKTEEELTKDNIRNFMYKELGTSLYRLIKEMDKYKEECKKILEKSEK